MRLAIVIGARHHHTDRLAFQNRKVLVAKAQDDVAYIILSIRIGQPEITLHHGPGGLGAVVQVHRWLGG